MGLSFTFLLLFGIILFQPTSLLFIVTNALLQEYDGRLHRI